MRAMACTATVLTERVIAVFMVMGPKYLSPKFPGQYSPKHVGRSTNTVLGLSPSRKAAV